MERWVAKVIAFFLIFILMTISGLLPIKVSDWYHSKGAKGEFYISVLNCFGGGVFFGTYLMHMAPEVREILDEKLLIPNNIVYPLPELAIGFGFFLLLFVDKIATIIAHQGTTTKTSAVEPSHAETFENGVMPVSHMKYDHVSAEQHNSPPASPRMVTRTHHDSVSSSRPATAENGLSNKKVEETQLSTIAINNAYENEKKDAEMSVEKSAAEMTEEDAVLAARPYIFLIALSIDCIFEGMSLGLQEDAYGVWMLVIAILSHELVITFSFGLRLVRLFSTKKVIIIIVSYSSTIPIGIIIGFAIYETGGGSDEIDIISGFFQAIAAGIFIYITFLEILNEELTHDTYISKPVAVLLGFLFMASMVLVENIGGEGDDSGSGVGDNGTFSAMSKLALIDA